AFHESIEWLKTLDHRALRDTSALPTLEAVKKFVNNDDLLPNGVRLVEINADTILFEDGNKRRVELADLSDGYRSILSLSLELVRQLVTHYDLEEIFDPQTHLVVAPGIVLIDEVDAHLHPSWQRIIGPCLRKLFRGFQFIVTTHSPLVCQGAADGCGSVFRLPKPGTTEEAKKLEGVELYRILYGNVLDAYGTGAFGEVERSEEGQQLRAELVALNLKEVSGGLTADEEVRQDELRAIFPGGK
ncbi:MAG TPA: AAA family ATPase, partial [Polyangium sp.]|nr:AAA family ATPase [Polyangium sp.]